MGSRFPVILRCAEEVEGGGLNKSDRLLMRFGVGILSNSFRASAGIHGFT